MPTLPIRRCSITLEKFSLITGIDPCGLYGIESPEPYQECLLFDCAKRSQFINALRSAQNLIKNKLNGPICDTSKTLRSKAPYFAVPEDWLLETRRTEDVVMTVVVPEPLETPPCQTIITLTGTLVLAECEYLVDAELAQTGCLCPRLATEFCTADYVVDSVDPDTGAQTITVTLTLRAYNLQDSTGTVSGADLDWLPDEVTVTFTIALPEKEARVYWRPSLGCCPVQEETCTAKGCCHLQECCACIQRSASYTVDVLDWNRCCVAVPCCDPFPHHFEIDVVEPGNWEDGWEQAVVSLANNLMPQDWCACNPMANLRYQRDTGNDNGAQRPDAMFYANPFGFYTAGAKFAWETVNKAVKKPVLVTL